MNNLLLAPITQECICDTNEKHSKGTNQNKITEKTKHETYHSNHSFLISQISDCISKSFSILNNMIAIKTNKPVIIPLKKCSINHALAFLGNLYMCDRKSIIFGKVIRNAATAIISKVKNIFRFDSISCKSLEVTAWSKDIFSAITCASACFSGTPEAIKSLYIFKVLTCSITSPQKLANKLISSILPMICANQAHVKPLNFGVYANGR